MLSAANAGAATASMSIRPGVPCQLRNIPSSAHSIVLSLCRSISSSHCYARYAFRTCMIFVICHFSPFSQKTYQEFFDAWDIFFTSFSYIPPVPLLSTYNRRTGGNIFNDVPASVCRKTNPIHQATAGFRSRKRKMTRKSG